MIIWNDTDVFYTLSFSCESLLTKAFVFLFSMRRAKCMKCIHPVKSPTTVVVELITVFM